MTYNVRGLMGLDRVHSVDRIARVIERANVDFAALQELTCAEKDGVDPPARLGELLGMHPSFVCSVETKHGQYGHALLSRFPVIRARHEILPRHHWKQTEPRSAVAHDVEIDARNIRIVSTHLSVLHHERVEQLRAIVNDGWLDGPSPVMFLGDLNCLPWSSALRVLDGRVHRAGRRYLPTWPAPIPFLALDHVFVSSHFEVVSVRAVMDGFARWASDHVPLLAELTLND
jgi:endonuclease/exonuclease/phosphatase family metal-dependent hydrolase